MNRAWDAPVPAAANTLSPGRPLTLALGKNDVDGRGTLGALVGLDGLDALGLLVAKVGVVDADDDVPTDGRSVAVAEELGAPEVAEPEEPTGN